MNQVKTDSAPTPRVYSPLGQLVLARVREFYREPEALFWVYGFPILMVVALGVAFRNKPIERIRLDVMAGPAASAVETALGSDERFIVRTGDPEECRLRLRTGKTDALVEAEGTTPPRYRYYIDPTRPESLLARDAADAALQKAAGRTDPAVAENVETNEPGSRYIDFLVPGLIGMSLMGGGLWGVGFVTVNMRIRKVLKRFLATPMKKPRFLAGIMISRLLFMVPEMVVLILFARLVFGVVNQGSFGTILLLIVLGAVMFSGIGLLVASRAKTVEAVSGLMNLVMLPMWVLSGIFFSSERFPDFMQPVIKVLPLTLLIDGLRGVWLEGTSLAGLGTQVGLLLIWCVGSFALALRWFRWQ